MKLIIFIHRDTSPVVGVIMRRAAATACGLSHTQQWRKSKAEKVGGWVTSFISGGFLPLPEPVVGNGGKKHKR